MSTYLALCVFSFDAMCDSSESKMKQQKINSALLLRKLLVQNVPAAQNFSKLCRTNDEKFALPFEANCFVFKAILNHGLH